MICVFRAGLDVYCLVGRDATTAHATLTTAALEYAADLPSARRASQFRRRGGEGGRCSSRVLVRVVQSRLLAMSRRGDRVLEGNRQKDMRSKWTATYVFFVRIRHPPALGAILRCTTCLVTCVLYRLCIRRTVSATVYENTLPSSA
jgi:hypothetical protein